MILTEQDKNSALWKTIKEHCQDRLAILRGQNEGDLNEIETAKMRGRIAEIKGLLSFDVKN